MDTVQLETFLLLSKLKNFTRTAEHLFVAQSTVTNRINELEQELGQTLFSRERKRVELTEAGNHFLTYAHRILELENSAKKELNTSSLYQSQLRIGTTNTMYECFIQKAASQFIQEDTSVSASISLGHSLDLLRKLQDGVLDIAFTYLPLKKPGYICKALHTEDLLLVTRSDHKEYTGGIHRSDLPNTYYLFCNFALQEVGQFIRELFPEYYQFPFEIDNSTKLPRYILEGLGYTFLPHSLVKDYLNQGKMSSIDLLDFEPPRITGYYILKEETESVITFLSMLEKMK